MPVFQDKCLIPEATSKDSEDVAWIVNLCNCVYVPEEFKGPYVSTPQPELQGTSF